MPTGTLGVCPSKISALFNYSGSVVQLGTADGTGGHVFTNTGREILVIQLTGTSNVGPVITPVGKALGVLNVTPVSGTPLVLGYGTTGSQSLVMLGPFDISTYNGNSSVGAAGTAAIAAANQVAVGWTNISVTNGTVNVWVVQVPSAQTPN